VSLNANLEVIELDGLLQQDSRILQGRPIQDEPRTFGEFLLETRNVRNVRGEVDTDFLYGFGVGGRVGFLWKLSRRLQVGAVYVPPTWMTDAKGRGKVDFTKHFEHPDLIAISTIAKLILPNNGRYGFANEYDVEMEFTLPQRVGVGMSYLLRDNLLLGVDFQWIDYSKTHFEIKVKLKEGNNVDFNVLAGSETIYPVFSIGWKDQYVIATGLVWQPSVSWAIRTGYNYGNNPVPKKYLNPQLAAISEHHVTLGCSYLISRNLTLHAAVEAALPNRLKSGNENLAYEDFVNSELKFFTIDAVLGLSLRF
jgi:long-subunit fatty acid transport protein